VGYPKSHPSDLDLAAIPHFVNNRGQTTIFRPATPPATLVTLHVLSASAPPTTTQDISLADRTADGRPQPLLANPQSEVASDISCVPLLEENSELLRSTEKTGQ
jgi:hypothetical protein